MTRLPVALGGAVPCPTMSTDPTWDLSGLYADLDDPALEADRQRCRALAADFAQRFRGRLARLDGPGLRGALEQYEEIHRLLRRPAMYASLRFAVATDDPACQAAQAASHGFEGEIEQLLAFFVVELKALDEEWLGAVDGAEALITYRHYLRTQQKFAPHTLSEDAEQTTARKDVTGKSAWVQLYTQITSGLRFQMKVGGEDLQLSRGELRPFRVSADRALREQAVQSEVDAFAPHRDTLGFVFNTLFEDHRLEMEARGYPDAMAYTILRDELDPDVVESLLATTNANRGLVHRYHALRKRLLGLDDYGTQDLLAPVFGEEPAVSWPAAAEAVLDAFASFSPEAGEVARTLIERRQVDVFPRPGKSSGAFCMPGLPPQRPFVLLNHAGGLEDAFTLAHELGHALHFTLALEQTPLNYWMPMPLAETASVFAELWLLDRMLEGADDDLRRKLLDRQVQAAMGTAFHQVAYINWERRAHARRARGAASPDEYSALWSEEMAALFGEAVTLEGRDAERWMSIPHFVFARFYCYSYAFGKLLTLGLYSLWKERGDDFVGAYLDLLRAGGSVEPAELLGRLDLDLRDPGFWQRGCDVVRGYLDELEALGA